MPLSQGSTAPMALLPCWLAAILQGWRREHPRCSWGSGSCWSHKVRPLVLYSWWQGVCIAAKGWVGSLATGGFRSGLGQVEISLLLGIRSFRFFTEGRTERAEMHAKKRKETTFLADSTDVYLQSGQNSAKSSGPGLRRAGEGKMAFRAFSCWDPGRGNAASATTGREDLSMCPPRVSSGDD